MLDNFQKEDRLTKNSSETKQYILIRKVLIHSKDQRVLVGHKLVYKKGQAG